MPAAPPRGTTTKVTPASNEKCDITDVIDDDDTLHDPTESYWLARPYPQKRVATGRFRCSRLLTIATQSLMQYIGVGGKQSKSSHGKKGAARHRHR